MTKKYEREHYRCYACGYLTPKALVIRFLYYRDNASSLSVCGKCALKGMTEFKEKK